MGVINLSVLVDKIKRKLLTAGFITKDDKASKSKFGVVKIGNGITVNSGVISVSASSDYSATEKQIGVWTDGTTPIYEMTFVKLDQAASSSSDLEMGDLPATTALVIDIAGVISSSDKSTYYANEYYSAAGKYTYYYVSRGETVKVKMKTSDSWSSANCIVRVRYTKSA